MTGTERQHLRTLIDQRRRELELEQERRPRCAGCGCLHSERSAGCRTCTNRWLRRTWRTSDTYRARERAYDKSRRPTGTRAKAAA